MLCRVAAVKSLPVHHHCAGYILFPFGIIEPILVTFSQTTLLPLKRLNQTESPIFVILCVLCFQRQSFFTFFYSLLKVCVCVYVLAHARARVLAHQLLENQSYHLKSWAIYKSKNCQTMYAKALM